MATLTKRPERPAVRSHPERSTLWASGKHVGSQTWADGPGSVNGWAFGPESHEKHSKKCFTALPGRGGTSFSDYSAGNVFRKDVSMQSESLSTPVRVHIVGRKNSGKTTLVCELVREFTSRGIRVATIKHTHHHHELDTPGKDSHLHREAGAAAVGILSPQMTAMFIPSDRELRGERRYEQFESLFADCRLILVEGDLHSTAVRIEVWRSVVSESPYALGDSSIEAVISDESLEGLSCSVWPRNNIGDIADRILKLLVPG